MPGSRGSHARAPRTRPTPNPRQHLPQPFTSVTGNEVNARTLLALPPFGSSAALPRSSMVGVLDGMFREEEGLCFRNKGDDDVLLVLVVLAVDPAPLCDATPLLALRRGEVGVDPERFFELRSSLLVAEVADVVSAGAAMDSKGTCSVAFVEPSLLCGCGDVSAWLFLAPLHGSVRIGIRDDSTFFGSI